MQYIRVKWEEHDYLSTAFPVVPDPKYNNSVHTNTTSWSGHPVYCPLPLHCGQCHVQHSAINRSKWMNQYMPQTDIMSLRKCHGNYWLLDLVPTKSIHFCLMKNARLQECQGWGTLLPPVVIANTKSALARVGSNMYLHILNMLFQYEICIKNLKQHILFWNFKMQHIYIWLTKAYLTLTLAAGLYTETYSQEWVIIYFYLFSCQQIF